MSNKHKHYEMIVAKAANMILVKFIKMDGEWENAGLSYKFISFSEEYDYFLCLPKHKDACLHWLNGGEVEILDGKGFYPFACYAVNGDWYPDHAFMNDYEEIRIKPKKEKRWIAFNHENGNVYGTFLSEDKCKMAWPNLQKFQIEVEV